MSNARLGELAIQRGWITSAQLKAALARQDALAASEPNRFRRIGHLLVKAGDLSPAQVVDLLAMQGIALYRSERSGRQYNVHNVNDDPTRTYLSPDDSTPMVRVPREAVAKVLVYDDMNRGYTGAAPVQRVVAPPGALQAAPAPREDAAADPTSVARRESTPVKGVPKRSVSEVLARGEAAADRASRSRRPSSGRRPEPERATEESPSAPAVLPASDSRGDSSRFDVPPPPDFGVVPVPSVPPNLFGVVSGDDESAQMGQAGIGTDEPDSESTSIQNQNNSDVDLDLSAFAGRTDLPFESAVDSEAPPARPSVVSIGGPKTHDEADRLNLDGLDELDSLDDLGGLLEPGETVSAPAESATKFDSDMTIRAGVSGRTGDDVPSGTSSADSSDFALPPEPPSAADFDGAGEFESASTNLEMDSSPDQEFAMLGDPAELNAPPESMEYDGSFAPPETFPDLLPGSSNDYGVDEAPEPLGSMLGDSLLDGALDRPADGFGSDAPPAAPTEFPDFDDDASSEENMTTVADAPAVVGDGPADQVETVRRQAPSLPPSGAVDDVSDTDDAEDPLPADSAEVRRVTGRMPRSTFEGLE